MMALHTQASTTERGHYLRALFIIIIFFHTRLSTFYIYIYIFYNFCLFVYFFFQLRFFFTCFYQGYYFSSTSKLIILFPSSTPLYFPIFFLILQPTKKI